MATNRQTHRFRKSQTESLPPFVSSHSHQLAAAPTISVSNYFVLCLFPYLPQQTIHTPPPNHGMKFVFLATKHGE